MSIALKALAKQILDCTRCSLRQNATQPVAGTGEVGAKYMLIGESPGREEDKAGVPFVGQSGQRLNKLLELAKIDQNECYFTNTCRCRPPENRDPRKAEMKACLPYLLQEIRLVKPQYIITLGRIPLSLFSDYGIKAMHGTSFSWEMPDA